MSNIKFSGTTNKEKQKKVHQRRRKGQVLAKQIPRCCEDGFKKMSDSRIDYHS